MMRVTAIAFLLAILGTAFACGGTASTQLAVAGLNLRQGDVPPDLKSCATVIDRLMLYTTQDEATARKEGAVEFSAVNYANDPSYCSSGTVLRAPLRLAQALLVRFKDKQSAVKAYDSHIFGVGVVIGSSPEVTTGSASGFGTASVRTISDPLYTLDWQKGSYVFKGGDVGLSADENLRAMTNVYSRVSS